MRKNYVQATGPNAVRSGAPLRPCQADPFPSASPAGGVARIRTGGSQFETVTNGMPMGLPTYAMKDEYGRQYSPVLTYGPLPVSAPVPVPIPSKIVQIAPIVAPLAVVPYTSDYDNN